VRDGLANHVWPIIFWPIIFWPIIWGESYVGETGKSTNAASWAVAQTRNRRPDSFFRTAASIFELAAMSDVMSE
jgi:hypothetical protein